MTKIQIENALDIQTSAIRDVGLIQLTRKWDPIEGTWAWRMHMRGKATVYTILATEEQLLLPDHRQYARERVARARQQLGGRP